MNDKQISWMSSEIFDQYIYKLASELILTISEQTEIQLIIDNSADIDDKSQKFLIYLLHQIDIKNNRLKIIFKNSYFDALDELSFSHFEIQ
jgi:hypothetical protein